MLIKNLEGKLYLFKKAINSQLEEGTAKECLLHHLGEVEKDLEVLEKRAFMKGIGERIKHARREKEERGNKDVKVRKRHKNPFRS